MSDEEQKSEVPSEPKKPAASPSRPADSRPAYSRPSGPRPGGGTSRFGGGRPGGGSRPGGMGGRPAFGSRPGTGGSGRPGAAGRPGAGGFRKKTVRGGRLRKKPNRFYTVFPEKATYVDFKDIEKLTRFLTEKGKIIPRRITGLTAKQQRTLCRAIKRARHAGLIAFQAES